MTHPAGASVVSKESVPEIDAAARSNVATEGKNQGVLGATWITPKADGPMLVMRDGRVHFLTLWERLQFVCGWTDAEKLDRKHRESC